MLEFENEMLLDVLNGDCLLVAAKGLSIETVVLNLIKVHCDPGNLVLVMGTTDPEEQYYLSELEKEGVTPLPKIISAEVGNNEREALYLGGGVMFISSRILVVDLLKGRVPISSITGIIVLRAHRILESYQEAFALRLYRQGNNSGFINAFSRSPYSFTSGLLKLERIMKTLFVTNLFLWPRFHATVTSTLKKKQPSVIELHVELTPAMNEIQTAALDLVHFCTKEIKRINPVLETEEITVENAISKSFYKQLQLQLDPVWHQLSAKTKQLVADLKILRAVLTNLTQSDCVRLHSFLMSLRTKEYTTRNSGWMILDSAETLFVKAKSRLFDSKLNLDPEWNPKWETLNEALKEIQNVNSANDGPKNVLILVESKSTVKQLKEYFIVGPKEMLLHSYYKLFGSDGLKKETNSITEEDEENSENFDAVTLTQSVDIENDCNSTFTECKEDLDSTKQPIIMIQQFKKDGDGLSLPKTLRELKPCAVIMYDVDISSIREIEIYQCSEVEKQIQVYFLIYGGSVEEQAYLTSLRKEKQAFEALIKEKAVIVVEDIKAGGGLARESCKLEQISTRKGGNPESKPTPKIIVDMREFRSELPGLIHKRGIDVEPVTLQIGDYILSPDMCVERKSISDLIGSLNSGRLYTQALAMTRFYAKPILLIEFDENKPFILLGRYYLSSDMSSSDIRAKLQLLTLHFPKLRLVWSPSPFASAQLFHELKEGREEPSAAVASSVGLEVGTSEDEKFEKYNIGIVDFVRKLPGVNSKNIRSLLEKGKSLNHLITLTQSELEDILGNSLNAELLFNALHKTSKPATDGSSSSNFRARGRGRGIGRRRRQETT
ncbi:hypothetical protein AAG570_012134 [Ranatra chinensis]|uniref:DNA repair endonuclease XPF n=1 Tax=Ranatra chinensis TaxID=642074 RepID=A0ABD0YHW9_9HEMI